MSHRLGLSSKELAAPARRRAPTVRALEPDQRWHGMDGQMDRWMNTVSLIHETCQLRIQIPGDCGSGFRVGRSHELGFESSGPGGRKRMVAGEQGPGWGRAEGTAGWHDHGHGLRGWGGEHSGCVGQSIFGTLSTVTKTHPTLSYLHPTPHFPAPTAPAPIIGRLMKITAFTITVAICQAPSSRHLSHLILAIGGPYNPYFIDKGSGPQGSHCRRSLQLTGQASYVPGTVKSFSGISSLMSQRLSLHLQRRKSKLREAECGLDHQPPCLRQLSQMDLVSNV